MFCFPFVCQGKKTAPLAQRGEKLYTQFSLFVLKHTHLTTNYRKGILVPINTEVEFISANKSVIEVRIPEYNLDVRIQNVEGFSGEKIDGIFARTLGREKVDLTNFTEVEQKSIKQGVAAVGMTKDATIKALGYPPHHRTPSLNLNEWRYWHNKFNTFLVVFDEGKVSGIKQ